MTYPKRSRLMITVLIGLSAWFGLPYAAHGGTLYEVVEGMRDLHAAAVTEHRSTPVSPPTTQSKGQLPTRSMLEVGFSPEGSAEPLVIKAIQAARSTLLVAAYSFTSPLIAQALVNAHRRGVDVRVVLDKSQRRERYSSATFLANMGIPVRIDAKHSIQHNKYLVIDGRHVETGSFNYTRSAALRNAENVLVIWNNPALAAIYARDWARHWQHSTPYMPRNPGER